MIALLIAAAVMLGLAASPPAHAERERVRAHLAAAEAQLRAADAAALTPIQRERRARVIAELARYRERGVFPRNLDFAAMTPYFIDDRGVRCAMAHLIETFGGAALVSRVSATANNARVAELAADPALRAWLDAHGMTVAEAARVQPTYRNNVGWTCRTDDDCYSERCIDAPDDPDGLGYCSELCDPAAAPCLRGLWDVPMICALAGDVHQCVYPGALPGTEGWTCDVTPDRWYCRAPLVCHSADPYAEEGICLRPRADCVDGDCPAVARAEPGCAASGGGGAGTALALLATLLALAARAR